MQVAKLQWHTISKNAQNVQNYPANVDKYVAYTYVALTSPKRFWQFDIYVN